MTPLPVAVAPRVMRVLPVSGDALRWSAFATERALALDGFLIGIVLSANSVYHGRSRRSDHATYRADCIPRVGYFNDRPPAEPPVIVHRGHPQVPRRRYFRRFVLSTLAGQLFGRAVHRSWSTLVNSGRCPAAASGAPSGCVRPVFQPAIQSNTSFDTVVLLHTTTNTGGVWRGPWRQRVRSTG